MAKKQQEETAQGGKVYRALVANLQTGRLVKTERGAKFEVLQVGDTFTAEHMEASLIERSINSGLFEEVAS